MSDEPGPNLPPPPKADSSSAADSGAAPERHAAAPHHSTLLSRLDAAMAEHVWYPRVVPFFTYLVLLAITGAVAERVPAAYPALYLIQIGSAERLSLSRDIDPKYGAAFHRARKRGVEAMARRCVITRDGIEIVDAVPIDE